MAVPYEMLLHPELLTNEQLIQIIEERHLRVSNMESIPRHELLEIFHNYCVPYGQRKYRDTGRGKLLNKTRQTSPEPKSALNNNNHCRKLSQPWPTERLKPPPDQLSGRVKLLKLDNKSAFTNNIVDTSKRKLCIDSGSTTDCTPPKRERKPITWP
ncbi:ashwin-like isoform X1 [Galleria mellonella]|uniref:Ashwin n=1 Tax=Galleria mellonella TaxID=7137 RepID=A0A6J1WN35_GALME|nr:ashwin-like isoform X1 [Galleria mellonella]